MHNQQTLVVIMNHIVHLLFFVFAGGVSAQPALNRDELHALAKFRSALGVVWSVRGVKL